MAEVQENLENPLEMRVGYQLRRASGVMMADLEARLDSLDLRPTEASILVLIRANPAIMQTEIGRALAIKRANMVPLTANLMARGLIARQAADGRSHALRLTAAGRTLATKAEAVMRQHEDHFLSGFSPAQRANILSLLKAIRRREDAS